MKVYILTASHRYGESEWVVGIFSSLKRAQEAADAEKRNSWDQYAITAYELDKPWSDEESHNREENNQHGQADNGSTGGDPRGD